MVEELASTKLEFGQGKQTSDMNTGASSPTVLGFVFRGLGFRVWGPKGAHAVIAASLETSAGRARTKAERKGLQNGMYVPTQPTQP